MNEKETQFILEYLKTRNIVQSYCKAFDVTTRQAQEKAFHLFREERIQKEIEVYRKVYENEHKIGVKDYLDFLIRGAFSDIGDYISFTKEKVLQYNPDGTILVDTDTGEPITQNRNKIYLKDSDKLDTSLIVSISNGKDGVKVQLVDKEGCWQRLKDFFGWTFEGNTRDTLNNQILQVLAGKVKECWGKEEVVDDKELYGELNKTLNKDDG